MGRFLSVVLCLAVASAAYPCWDAIDPAALAEVCPIIVTGTIESVVEAAPGGNRSDDLARLRIDTVHRNALTDVALKAGDLFVVKMISKNNQSRSSTDLNYPIKTKAVWMIMLTSKGEFRIDVRPEQKQALNFAPRFMEERREVRRADNDAARLANPAGFRTTPEWIAWKKAREVRQAKAIEDQRAQQKAVRDLAKVFADAERLEDVWQRYENSARDVRRDLFNLSQQEQPISGARLAEVARLTLLKEKDDNIRTASVSYLAYSRDPGAKATEVLAEALRDHSASVRLFACQSVKFRRYESLAPQVKELQNDPDRQVSEMAKATLEFWRTKAPAK